MSCRVYLCSRLHRRRVEERNGSLSVEKNKTQLVRSETNCRRTALRPTYPSLSSKVTIDPLFQSFHPFPEQDLSSSHIQILGPYIIHESFTPGNDREYLLHLAKVKARTVVRFPFVLNHLPNQTGPISLVSSEDTSVQCPISVFRKDLSLEKGFLKMSFLVGRTQTQTRNTTVTSPNVPHSLVYTRFHDRRVSKSRPRPTVDRQGNPRFHVRLQLPCRRKRSYGITSRGV